MFTDLTFIVAAAALVLAFIFAIITIVLIVKVSRLNRRITSFLFNSSDKYNLEELLVRVIKENRELHLEIKANENKINVLYKKMTYAVQKVGIVRYPFKGSDVGGDLCYAIALLDERNNGVVLNSIYGRENCYTYAKPIINLTSKYTLSEEEKESVKRALTNSYVKDGGASA